VKAVISVIIPAAAVTVVTVGNAEHTLDGANCAADTGADDPANCTADRTCDPVALVGAFLGTAHDALGVAGRRLRTAVGRANRPAIGQRRRGLCSSSVL